MNRNDRAKVEIIAQQGDTKIRFRPGDKLVMDVYTDPPGYAALTSRIENLGLAPNLERSKPMAGEVRRYETTVEVPADWTPPRAG
jgi:hypothetical protein